jgi:hypothetical protein
MRKPTAKNKLNPPFERLQAHDESTVTDTSNDATSLRKYKKKEAQSTDIEELTEATPNWEPDQDAVFESSLDADMGTLETPENNSGGHTDPTDAIVGQAAPSFDLNHFILSGAYEYAALQAASSSTLLTAGAGLIGAAALGGGSSATQTNLNQAPTIVDQAIYLPQISSGASAPIGQVGALVSTLTTGIRDANEGDRKGIAITEIDDKLGLLFYSLNNGVTWTLAEGISPSNALLLADDANTRIYIRPTSNHLGLVSDVAQFRGWDQTTGTHGSRSDVRQFGGNSAFSGEVDSIGLNIVTSLIGDYSENGAPITAHPSLALPTPMNGHFSAVSVEIMGGFSQGDVLSVTNEGPFTAVYHPEAGRLEIKGMASHTAYQTFLRKVTFSSNVDDPLKFGAMRSLVWQISDEAGNLYENQVNQLRIIAENDAPILMREAIKLSDAAFGSGLPVASSGDLVSRFVSTVMDPDGTHAKSGLAIIQIAPHVILYFSTDGGLNWNAATDLSPTNALHLMKDSDNKIYLQTLPGFSGNIHESFSFRAWDQTSGIDGLMSEALPVGGTSAYSLEIGGGLTPWTTVFNLTSSSPADNGYMVNVTDNLTLTFNRPTAMGTGSIQLYTAAGTLVETIHVTSSLVTGWGGPTLTVNPNTTLTAGAAYYLRISPAAIRDTVGHTYAGINDATTLNFGVLASDGSVEANMNTDPTRSAVGYSVSGAGDLNGDGYADYLVGGSNTDNSVFVVYGDASGLGTSFTGGTIESSKGFRFYSFGNQVGIYLSGVGDVNGDGFDDVMLASTATSGLTYVVYGGVSNAGITTDANGNIPTSAGFKITGSANSHLGYSVSGAGDVNGDGIADLIFGAMGTGSAYVMFGQAANRTNFNLSGRTISSTDGFEIKGVGGSGLGRAVSSAGDVNGDGLADLVVSNGQDRVTYVVYGKTNGLTLNLSSFAPKDGFRITSLENTSRFGWSVDSAGDVNGDGLADVLLTSELTNSVYVVFGNASGTSVAIDSSGNIADGLGFKIKSNMANNLGNSASSAGDVNGDGLSDIIIGTNVNPSAGAFVVFGKSSNATVSIANGKILSNDGFKITGATNSAFGFSVSGAGDINGDGLADVLVGSQSKGYALVLGGTQWTAAAVRGSGALTGTSAAEAIIGSAGVDTLIGGGGVDRFFAGMGNDTVLLTASDITNLANTTAGAPKASVHGGGGFDTLRLSGGADLNLTTISNVGAMGHEEDSRIESIERVDLATDTASNTLTLAATDVKDMGGFNQIRTGSVSADGNTWTNVTGSALSARTAYHQLVLDGSSNDSLVLSPDTGYWFNAGTVSNGSSNYNVYQNFGTNSQVLVKSGVAVTNNDPNSAPVLSSTSATAAPGLLPVVGGTSVWNRTATYGSSSLGGITTNITATGDSTPTRTSGAGATAFMWIGDQQSTETLSVLFDKPVYQVRIEFEALNNDGFNREQMSFQVNGVNLVLTSANLSPTGTSVSGNTIIGNGGGLYSITSTTAINSLTVTQTIVSGGPSGAVVAIQYNSAPLQVSGGVAISSLMPAATDADGSVVGYAITSAATETGADATPGSWQYLNGSTWTSLANASVSQAVYLNASTLVRWNDNDRGYTALSAVAVDNTVAATLGQALDVTTRGGASGFSSGIATLATTVAPVVIDLNRDGMLSYSSVTMDVNGDGHLDTTAWAAAQDGVLVWDKLGDGWVHDNSQYAFAQYAPTCTQGLDAQGKAPTDLSGLAAGFDTNLDGLLNDQDALFAEFMVWQDANQNGVSDAGEVRSLADWGITEIHLVSDGVQRTPAPGVVEAGRTTATLTDGTHLLVSDAAFEYTPIHQQALYMF